MLSSCSCSTTLMPCTQTHENRNTHCNNTHTVQKCMSSMFTQVLPIKTSFKNFLSQNIPLFTSQFDAFLKYKQLNEGSHTYYHHSSVRLETHYMLFLKRHTVVSANWLHTEKCLEPGTQGSTISVTYRGYEGRTQGVIDVPDCLQNT